MNHLKALRSSQIGIMPLIFLILEYWNEQFLNKESIKTIDFILFNLFVYENPEYEWMDSVTFRWLGRVENLKIFDFDSVRNESFF